MSETEESVELPVGLLSLLENANDTAKSAAESIEGALALYAVNRIPKDSLKKRLRALLDVGTSLAVPSAALPTVSVAATQVDCHSLEAGLLGTQFVPGMSLVSPYMTLPTVWGASLTGNMQAGYVLAPDSMFVLSAGRTFFEEEPQPRILFEQPKSVPYEITVLPKAA